MPIRLLAIILLLGACRTRDQSSDPSANPAARAAIGKAVDFRAIDLNARDLQHSVTKRRAYAWDLVKRINQPVGLDATSLAIPLWQTWYDIDEFRDIFREFMALKKLDSTLAPNALSSKALDSFQKTRLDAYWTQPDQDHLNRFDRFLKKLNDSDDIHSLNGVGRGIPLFSPSLIKHVLENYEAMLACKNNAEMLAPNRIPIGACYQTPFPQNAAVVKLTWIKESVDLPYFDTSAAGLRKTLVDDKGVWKPAGKAPPLRPLFSANANRVNPKQPQRNYLLGFSISTKEIPQWTWTTLWWDPHPENDFGEDNPFRGADMKETKPENASVVLFGNYKMCVVTDFLEKDPELLKPESGASELSASLFAAANLSKPYSWCSNPYIETMARGADSNCIGCHQHAGPNRGSFEEATDKHQQRNHFDADFVWAFDGFTRSFIGEMERVLFELQR